MAKWRACGSSMTEAQMIANLYEGLVSYVPLDETGGLPRDAIIGHSLVEHNTVATAPGRTGVVASFTTVNSEQFHAPNNKALQITPGQDFTVACWTYFDETNFTQGLLAKRGGDANEWELYMFNPRKFVWAIRGSISDATELISGDLARNAAWHFVVAEWDASAEEMRLQIDNGTVATAAATFTGIPAISNSPVYYGSYGGSFYHNGRLAESMIWKRLLTQEEKLYLYNEGLGTGRDFEMISLPYTHTFAPTDLSENGYSTDEGDYYRNSAFAYATLTTTATILSVDVYSNIAATYPAFGQLNVRVNGSDYTPIAPNGNGLKKTITMLEAGTKTVTITAGLQSRPSSTILGTHLVGVSANAPITVVAPSSSSRLLVYGDSIAVGANADVPSRDGWVSLLRNDRGNVMLEGYGFRALYNDAATAGNRSDFADFIDTLNPSIIWMAIGTNDYGLEKWSAADFGTAYGALLTAINTRLPSATIYCQAPITRGTETANSFGSTLGDYRTQISNAAAARPGFCTYVDGSAWTITLDTDNLHPTSTGHSEYYTEVATVLGL